MIGAIIAGIVIGYLANIIFGGEGKGCIMNLLLGIVGSAFGGWLFSLLNISWGGLIGEIGTGVVGAIALLWICNRIFRK